MYSKNNIFGYLNRKREIQNRTWSLMVIFILLFFILIWRISNHMYFKAEPLKTMFNAQYTIDESYGILYKLFDCNGKELLDYVVSYYAAIDPGDYLRFNEYTSKYDLEILTITLRNYNSNYDLEKIKNSPVTEKIKYKLDEKTYEKLKNIKDVKGFYVYSTKDLIKDKVWKVENLLSNPKYYKDGNLDPVFKSEDSLEMQIYNKTKGNEYNKVTFTKGVNGDISEGEVIYPKNNINVRLTLDKGMQDKIESILHEKQYDQASVVLMESSTGKIRAMAQKDDNAYNANLGIPGTNGFFAGSTFKVVVDEAGIDNNLIDNYKKYKVNGTLFPDSHERFNTYSVSDALAYSSNDIFAQLGWKVGLKNMKDYAEKQGMLSKVLGFHHEQIGKFEVNLLSPTVDDISHTAIGQKVRMTPLEMLSIPNTIINNGIYVKPTIIDSYVNNDNKVLEKVKLESYAVLKSDTAKIVKQHMINAVNKGTGTSAFIQGMNIGGKTGTSEYYVSDKEYSDGWFAGFFTLNDKNYSMVVFVPGISINKENGEKDDEGGNTAAPIFKEIVNALKYMN